MAKDTLLKVLQILKEETDENHFITTSELAALLGDEKSGKTANRETVYNAIKALKAMDFDITTCRGSNENGYKLMSRELETEELQLLISSIYSTNFIEANQSDSLVKKLKKLSSKHAQERLSKILISKTDDHKTPNYSFFLNVQLINEAIQKKKQISFDFVSYNLEKELVNYRDTRDAVSPFALFCSNERFFMVCKGADWGNIGSYRLEYIRNIEILEEDSIQIDPERMNYLVNNSVNMYISEPETVELLCKNILLNAVIDQFGQNVTISKFDDERFKLTMKVSTKGLSFWALRHLENCEVISPKHLRDEIVNLLKNNAYFNQ